MTEPFDFSPYPLLAGFTVHAAEYHPSIKRYSVTITRPLGDYMLGLNGDGDTAREAFCKVCEMQSALIAADPEGYEVDKWMGK